MKLKKSEILRPATASGFIAHKNTQKEVKQLPSISAFHLPFLQVKITLVFIYLESAAAVSLPNFVDG